jgi:hypothetical protein
MLFYRFLYIIIIMQLDDMDHMVVKISHWISTCKQKNVLVQNQKSIFTTTYVIQLYDSCTIVYKRITQYFNTPLEC